MREFVEKELAPRLRGDGGWVEYVDLNEGEMTLVFRGECSKCHILDRCTAWMEEKIEQRFGEKIHIVAVRKKPFFWDVK